MAVVVNGKPVWQFQHGVDVAQAVTVCVTTPAACEQPQGRVTILSMMQKSLEQLNLQPSLVPGRVVTVTVGTQLMGDACACTPDRRHLLDCWVSVECWLL